VFISVRLLGAHTAISAILTQYTSLRSYQEIKNKGTPLDYENAGMYTSALLDAYIEYKNIWKQIETSELQYFRIIEEIMH
jgi:hypothetical protein